MDEIERRMISIALPSFIRVRERAHHRTESAGGPQHYEGRSDGRPWETHPAPTRFISSDAPPPYPASSAEDNSAGPRHSAAASVNGTEWLRWGWRVSI